ncbi:MAG: hypothetical protein ACI8PT_002152 [Gammaproteobacteria bacterium]|jgi:hypothetical protein
MRDETPTKSRNSERSGRRSLGAMLRPHLVGIVGVLALSGSALFPSIAVAADADGKFAVKGVARTHCKTFVKVWEERRETPQPYVLYAGWMDGYLSALNERTPGTYDITSFEATELLGNFVYANCKRAPEQPFFNMMRGLVQALNGRRLPSQSPLVPIEGTVELSDGASRDVRINLYEETIRRAQNSLKLAGAYDGEVDGVYSDATRAAIKTYQADNGLRVSGMPDQFTLLRLFRPVEAKTTANPDTGDGKTPKNND